MKELRHLNKYFLKYKHYLLLGILFTVISNLFGILPAQLVSHSLDIVRNQTSRYFLLSGFQLQQQYLLQMGKGISLISGLILSMAILKGIFLFAIRQTIIVMSRCIEYDLKNEIFKHYQSLPQSFFRVRATGDLMARITEDVSKVRMYVGPSMMYLINMVVMVIMVLTYMFSVNVRLTSFILLPMPVLSLGIYWVSTRINKQSECIQRSLARLSASAQETFSGIRVIKSYAEEKFFVKSFETESLAYQRESLKLVNIDALFYPFVSFIFGLLTILIVFVGGQEIFAGRLTLGNIAEFVIYVFMLTWPLTSLGWTSGQIQRAAASQKRINDFLKESNTIRSTENFIGELKPSIRFSHVDFIYPETGIEALKNINFEISEGATLAIVGNTGCGKSSLAQLLLRFYDPVSGYISVGDRDLASYDVQFLRSQLGYVAQDVFLFSDTIENNIQFGIENTEAEAEEVKKAAEQAVILNQILELSNGLQTKIGERGVTLSGGQKQRISIARALIKSPKILILDDSLSAVDPHTEYKILQNLKEIPATKIIISHRLSNARFADKILVLDQGKQVAFGTHEALYDTSETYRVMFEKQMYNEVISNNLL